MKIKLNKLLLKATSIVVIGAFLFSTAFVDLVWAKANSLLRVVSMKEDSSKVITLGKMLTVCERFRLRGEEITLVKEMVDSYLKLREAGHSHSEVIEKLRNQGKYAKFVIVVEQITDGYTGGMGVASLRVKESKKTEVKRLFSNHQWNDFSAVRKLEEAISSAKKEDFPF